MSIGGWGEMLDETDACRLVDEGEMLDETEGA